ncbi:hypothetical protein WICPIJ_001712 [Wickerhamomyces pijperi]|uniref:Uncharacterized protein n=1 Tax=Wickerhamomyces pijperi TaxID=599730 RepID=A0A9P8TQI2_WICPI|nr:hypothetical protein WICPIJ_001712 [Wickerhamomyces pijperi]
MSVREGTGQDNLVYALWLEADSMITTVNGGESEFTSWGTLLMDNSMVVVKDFFNIDDNAQLLGVCSGESVCVWIVDFDIVFTN